MTLDLAHLERLLAEATPGRWRVDGSFDIYRDPNGAPDDNGDIVCRGYDHADARLIVAMHSALLELIAAARERDEWQRAAESQNRQWSQKCEALTEERARREELAAQLLATQQDRHRILMERDEMAAAARERDEAWAFLRRTAMTGGSIVSSAAMTATQIAIARAADRMLVTPDGYGFVYVPGPRFCACGRIESDCDQSRDDESDSSAGRKVVQHE